MFKRIICLALCALMLMSAAVGITGCKKDEDTDTGTVSTEPVDTGTRDDQLELAEGLYYDGADFTMLLRSDRNNAPEEFDVDISAEGISVVDQAVYDRQLTIQDTMGVNFVYNYVTESGENGIVNTIKKSVEGGTDDFDVACPGGYQVAMLATEGVVFNWKDVPHINLSKVWWGSRSGMADSLTINGYLPFLTGDASNLSIGKALCMYFNKGSLKIHGGMSEQDMYELVRSGEWTIDKLTEISKTISKDLDGDGQISGQGDLYGCNIYFLTIIDNYFAAFDIPVVAKNSYDEYEINLNNETMYTGMEKLLKLCYSDNSTFIGEGKYDCIKFFSDKKAVFTHGGLEWAPEIVARGFTDYGIIPYPKLSTDQENYSTTLSDNYSAFVIDLNASESKADKVGAVMEYMGYLSYGTTTFAYYDVLLKGRSAQDPESVEMLDLIHDSINYDLGFIYSSALGWPVNSFRDVLKGENHTIGAWVTYEANKSPNWTAKLKTFMSAFYDEAE